MDGGLQRWVRISCNHMWEEANLSFGAMMSLAHSYNWDSHSSSKWD